MLRYLGNPIERPISDSLQLWGRWMFSDNFIIMVEFYLMKSVLGRTQLRVELMSDSGTGNWNVDIKVLLMEWCWVLWWAPSSDRVAAGARLEGAPASSSASPTSVVRPGPAGARPPPGWGRGTEANTRHSLLLALAATAAWHQLHQWYCLWQVKRSSSSSRLHQHSVKKGKGL